MNKQEAPDQPNPPLRAPTQEELNLELQLKAMADYGVASSEEELAAMKPVHAPTWAALGEKPLTPAENELSNKL